MDHLEPSDLEAIEETLRNIEKVLIEIRDKFPLSPEELKRPTVEDSLESLKNFIKSKRKSRL